MNRDAAARAIEAFLRALGRDPDGDPDLGGTGDRVASAWADELLAGYEVDVDALLAGSVLPGTTHVVVVRDLPVATTCPHHLLASIGSATVAYAPGERLVGLGAVAAVVDAFSRRLILQEQIGQRVVDALAKHLCPRWVACRITLTHACLSARGPRAHGAVVETTATAGDEDARALALAALGAGR